MDKMGNFTFKSEFFFKKKTLYISGQCAGGV